MPGHKPGCSAAMLPCKSAACKCTNSWRRLKLAASAASWLHDAGLGGSNKSGALDAAALGSAVDNAEVRQQACFHAADATQMRAKPLATAHLHWHAGAARCPGIGFKQLRMWASCRAKQLQQQLIEVITRKQSGPSGQGVAARPIRPPRKPTTSAGWPSVFWGGFRWLTQAHLNALEGQQAPRATASKAAWPPWRPRPSVPCSRVNRSRIRLDSLQS